VRVLAFDPGVTTGWAFFDGPELVVCGEAKWDEVANVIETNEADVIVYESWRLYPWKKNQAVWDEFPAVQVIGIIKEFARRLGIPIVEQAASVKQVMTDNHLRKCGLWVKGSTHMRDAIRHAAFYYVTTTRETL